MLRTPSLTCETGEDVNKEFNLKFSINPTKILCEPKQDCLLNLCIVAFLKQTIHLKLKEEENLLLRISNSKIIENFGVAATEVKRQQDKKRKTLKTLGLTNMDSPPSLQLFIWK